MYGNAFSASGFWAANSQSLTHSSMVKGDNDVYLYHFGEKIQ